MESLIQPADFFIEPEMEVVKYCDRSNGQHDGRSLGNKILHESCNVTKHFFLFFTTTIKHIHTQKKKRNGIVLRAISFSTRDENSGRHPASDEISGAHDNGDRAKKVF